MPGQTEFESDDPRYQAGGDRTSDSPGADAGAVSDTGGAATDAGTGDPSAAARAIEEADIVKIDGGRLYALSRTGGLSVIDIATRDKPVFLGRYRAVGDMFEMYVRDQVVLLMVNGFVDWSSWEYGGASTSARQTSTVIALDTRDAAKMATLGRFDVPGEVSDSRVVGDVMYVVSHQNGYCWGCATTPTTAVLSLGIKDARAIAKIDQTAFASKPGWSWWKRSVAATDKRMWIGGPDYSWESGTKPHSTIQALDISDPGGKLALGATVTVDGIIQSRWQMDELGGVLRVVSQPGGWAGAEPTLQTFTVKSSTEVTPLASLTIKLPRPETLTSVRFDGQRAYAITVERKDPLFTFDLSDPAKPLQVGALEMPGWVTYLEPRGDRLVGLGFDPGNPEGAMTVSLFDVSNLAAPTMKKRVNFGKGWASAPEDQDRIHKAFRVLDADHLILVPFSSYDYRATDGSCNYGTSGIQLIDWKDDSLTLRGVAKVHGQARRALLHDERLFAVSENEVATFDIGNRDVPAGKASVPLSTPSHRAVVVGKYVVQLSNDWYSQTAQLAITSADSVEQAIPTATVDLSSMVGDKACGYGWGGFYGAQLFTNGAYVYVVADSYYYDTYYGTSRRLVGVVDVRDPTHPALIGRAALSLPTSGYGYGPYGYYGGYYGSDGVLSAGESMVLAGDSILSVRQDWAWGDKGPVFKGAYVDAIDLSDPRNPKEGKSVTLPAGAAYGALTVAGGKVFTWHYVPTGDGKVRFYLDELSATSPPVVLRSVNVPGSLAAFDPTSSRATTVDYRRTFYPATTYEACRGAVPKSDIPYFGYGETPSCEGLHRTLRLVSVFGSVATYEGSLELPEGVSQIVPAGTNLLLHAFGGYGYGGYYGYDGASPSDRLWVLGGAGSGKLELSAPLDLGKGYGSMLWASGDRAVSSSYGDHRLTVLDVGSAKGARVVRTVDVNGYYTAHVAFGAGRAYASLGEYGITSVPLF